MSTEENNCPEQVQEEPTDVKPVVEHSVKVSLIFLIDPK